MSDFDPLWPDFLYGKRWRKVWKQAAKKWREKTVMNKDEYIKKLEIHNVGLVRDADRRLELLRDWNSRRVNEQEACLFCGEYPMTTERIEKGKREFVFWDKHSGDCELAKELSDA
jgi:hypothetical protein